MPDGSAPTTRHRTLWISDVHLGSPGCRAGALTRFLAANDCETLYLVGDIFDGWRLKKRFYWTPDHTRVIKAILAKARHGTRVYYVTGNHDAFMRQFVSRQLRLGRVRVRNEIVHVTADNRRLLVVHGDLYDAVVTTLPWLAHAGDTGYEALLWGGTRLNGLLRKLRLPELPVSAGIKLAVKSAVQYLSGFDEQVMARCRADGFNGVVSGHTHHAEARMIRLGIVSYNCGDWVESCSALAEDASGRISILRHSESTPSRSADAPGARSEARALRA